MWWGFGGLIGLIIWIAIAFWPARVAGRKGHSFFGYFLLSLLFFPLSLFLAYMVDDRSATPGRQLLSLSYRELQAHLQPIMMRRCGATKRRRDNAMAEKQLVLSFFANEPAADVAASHSKGIRRLIRRCDGSSCPSTMPAISRWARSVLGAGVRVPGSALASSCSAPPSGSASPVAPPRAACITRAWTSATQTRHASGRPRCWQGGCRCGGQGHGRGPESRPS